MKIKIAFSFLVFIFSSGTIAFTQVDSIAKAEKKLTSLYSGLGINFCSLTGAGISLNGNFVLSNNWGGTVRLNFSTVIASKLPEDYYNPSLFLFQIPTDDFFMIFFSADREFPTSSKYFRFGMEFGPSVMIYNMCEFKKIENPIPFLQKNYDVSHTKKIFGGISARVKFEAPFTKFLGVEIAVFTNLNVNHSVIGLDLCLNAGMLRRL